MHAIAPCAVRPFSFVLVEMAELAYVLLEVFLGAPLCVRKVYCRLRSFISILYHTQPRTDFKAGRGKCSPHF